MLRTINAVIIEMEYANDSSISEVEELNIPTLVLPYQFKPPALSWLDNTADCSLAYPPSYFILYFHGDTAHVQHCFCYKKTLTCVRDAYLSVTEIGKKERKTC